MSKTKIAITVTGALIAIATVGIGIGRITAPVLVVADEFDIMPLSDTVYIHDNIANSEIE